jgi:hypothetical protein
VTLARQEEEVMMIHADPWEEIPRLESVLEAEVLAELEHSRLVASAEHFCVRKCRVDGHCPLGHTRHSRDVCPLWAYVRSTPSVS